MRRDKKKKRRKNHWEIGCRGGGWRNLPFMRGGYGSRGVCRLIRVFLVRFLLFPGTLMPCRGKWLDGGQVNIRYAPCGIPGGIVPRFRHLINCIPPSWNPSFMHSTSFSFHREIYYDYKYIYVVALLFLLVGRCTVFILSLSFFKHKIKKILQIIFLILNVKTINVMSKTFLS